MLLAIPNPAAKRQLASRAASQDWPSRRLSDEVRRWRVAHHLPPVGRPQHHPVIASLLRTASSARRAADAAEEGELPSEVHVEAERLERLAAKHLARLRAAVAPPKAPSGVRRKSRTGR